MISAKVIADSVSPAGFRITTVEARYPRYIHAEFMTHRTFSRNASSSRAIPSKRIRAAVRQDPVRPVFWGQNQAGMQAAAELEGWRRWAAEQLFLGARYPMLGVVWGLEKLGLHKQLANRLIEPWSHITVVMTATEWKNFFALRIHKDAQPEMCALATAIRDALKGSKPRLLSVGEWHLPYVTDLERSTLYVGFGPQNVLIKMSVARCARVSYLNHDGTTSTPQKDIELHDRLVSSGHMSPTEHQATPTESGYAPRSNVRGWVQYRKQLPNEAEFQGAR